MTAVVEIGLAGPVVPGELVQAGAATSAPAPDRRVVAVAVSAMELMRPESDLARLVESFATVDVLLASDDGAPRPDDDDSEDDDPTEDHEGAMSAVAGLSMGAVAVHRLGLRTLLAPGAEDDIVAALSELVGFDPEPGVYCLAPALSTSDPARAVVGAAAQRIAQVYGLPLLRYRCLELSVVTDER